MMKRTWDLGDLVGQVEIARLFRVQKATVANWITRYDDFPDELIRISGAPIFSRAEVIAWHRKRWPNGQESKTRGGDRRSGQQ